MASGFEQIYEDMQLAYIIGVIKYFIDNINDYMPLNKLFQIIIYIFTYEFQVELNIYFIYTLKFLFSIIIIIMPIILLIITLINFNSIISKNKKYWWTKEKYNYLNTKYIYIKKIYNIFGITLSQNILKYLSLSISFIIVSSILLIKFKDIIDNDNDISKHFYKILYYNGALFLVIFLIISIYLAINYNKYNRVFKYNKNLNNIYLRYLNKDYMKKICNNFIDDDNNIVDTCTFKSIPNTINLNEYLNTMKTEYERIEISDLELDNENTTINYSTQTANKFLSALITHQFLTFLYNNQFNEKTKDNKFCRELKLDNILNNKIDNIFYCFKETTQFPFTTNIDGELLGSASQIYFALNYEVYTKIIDKYLEINNNLSEYITNIRKENIDEITITIFIAILFIFYLIGLFFIFNIDK